MTLPICRWCGHAGEDVGFHDVKGLLVEECDDLAACFERWEDLNKGRKLQ